MIHRFVEVDDGAAYGKFSVCRFDPVELAWPTAMPEAQDRSPKPRLLTYAGRRRFNDHSTLVVDLQRGTGFAWPLENGEIGFEHYLREKLGGDVRSLVCPLYLPFVRWLHLQRKWALGAGDLREIPSHIILTTAR